MTLDVVSVQFETMGLLYKRVSPMWHEALALALGRRLVELGEAHVAVVRPAG